MPWDRERGCNTPGSIGRANQVGDPLTVGQMPRCRCQRWRTYVGAYDRDGYTLRCRGCMRAIARCTCG